MISYDYKCPKHPVVVLRHSIKDTDEVRYCQRKGCGEVMSRLISSRPDLAELPCIFEGRNWSSKNSKQYTEYKINLPKEVNSHSGKALDYYRDPAATWAPVGGSKKKKKGKKVG